MLSAGIAFIDGQVFGAPEKRATMRRPETLAVVLLLLALVPTSEQGKCEYGVVDAYKDYNLLDMLKAEHQMDFFFVEDGSGKKKDHLTNMRKYGCYKLVVPITGMTTKAPETATTAASNATTVAPTNVTTVAPTNVTTSNVTAANVTTVAPTNVTTSNVTAANVTTLTQTNVTATNGTTSNSAANVTTVTGTSVSAASARKRNFRDDDDDKTTTTAKTTKKPSTSAASEKSTTTTKKSTGTTTKSTATTTKYTATTSNATTVVIDSTDSYMISREMSTPTKMKKHKVKIEKDKMTIEDTATGMFGSKSTGKVTLYFHYMKRGEKNTREYHFRACYGDNEQTIVVVGVTSNPYNKRMVRQIAQKDLKHTSNGKKYFVYTGICDD